MIVEKQQIEPGNDQIELCASIGYDAIRRFARTANDKSHPVWEDAPEWQKRSNRMQARYALRNATPQESHEMWRDERLSAGWTYGDKRDPETKSHPALLPFGDLDSVQRAKNILFHDVVTAASKAFFQIPT